MTAWKPSTDLTIAAALGLGMLAVYLANGRSAGGGDVVPATLASVALTRGDGPFLDRFAPLIRDDSGRLPGYAEDSRGRAVSRYPVGPALLAAPLVWPQVRVLDHARPGWEHQGEITLARCDRMAKNAAAFLTAAAVALSWSLLRAIGLGRTSALLACLIAALGSGYWPVASQALWQHGPAALCLTAALGLLTSGFEGPIQPSSAWVRRRFRRFGRWTGFGTVALETLPQTHGDEVAATNLRAGFSSLARLSLAGAFSAMLVACRPIDAVFSVALGLWVLAYFPRRGRWAFFAPAVIGAFVLIGYNLYFFDTITGGYAKIEQMHPWAHGTKGTFTGSLIEGGFGTLLSPSHGLWVYCPWVLVVTVSLAIPSVRRRLWSDCSPIGWLSGSLVPYFALLGTYSCWWGGHSFGPRFWIDAVPIFTVWLGFSLEWASTSRRGRSWRVGFAVSVIVSVGIQVAGFLCYPSSWYGSPTNADLDHARLWDWRDSELTRGLAEGIRPRQW